MNDSVVTLPFGVADFSSHTGVFRRLPDGVDAVDLRTGALLWSSPLRALPVGISGNRVLARLFTDEADSLDFVILDAADGSEVARTDTTFLPPSVSTRDASFSLAARGAGERFMVDWTAEGRYHGGAPPKKDSLAGGTMRGAIAVDSQGQTSPAAPADSEAAPAPPLQLELTSDYVVIAREPDSGTVLWEYPLGKPIKAARPPQPQ